VLSSFHRSARSNLRRPLAAAAAAAVLVPGLALGSATAASAATLPQDLSGFANCPISNHKVTVCLYSVVNSGSFTIGSTTLAITSPLTIDLGLIPKPNATLKAVAPTNGTPVLQGAPIPVPILDLPPLPGPLSITATTNLVSLPTLALTALETGQGTALTMPLDVAINNVLIGPGCTIGTTTDPIDINLTTGTTSPPPPNQPITGSPGTGSVSKQSVITFTGTTLVDNSFSVPGASGCGLFGVLDPALDLVAGLPSAAGHNTAILNATSSLAPASLIRHYLG
jgi:hypothetical protein